LKLGPSKSPFKKRNRRLGWKPVGIRLERKKEASLLNWNLKRPYPPEKIRVPVSPAAMPCVRPGDKVEIGQRIAAAKSPEGASIHAGMSGVVEKIVALSDALGGESMMIEIRRPREPKPLPAWELREGWEQIPAEKLLEIFQDSGLLTTDQRMEAVHAKLQRNAAARTIVINGCEPEPYITCEQVLTLSHPVEILKGAELLRKACGAVPIPVNFRGSEIGAVPTTVDQKKIEVGAENIIFAFEDSNLETVELIKSKIYFLKWEHVEVRIVPALYPQGLESTLLQAWFPGEEDNAVVFPASTAFAVYEAVALGKPFYERVVTVGGECVVEPRSLWLPVGISFHDAIQACKGVMREPHKILMGGPMAGTAQTTREIPVMAGTTAVLALPLEVAKEEVEEPCIRCNLCVDHCPVSLSPAMITLAVEQQEFSIADEWGASHCIECGNCAYVCPSKRPMLELIRLASVSKKAAAFHG
jgi:electron transport complex protein RnfC